MIEARLRRECYTSAPPCLRAKSFFFFAPLRLWANQKPSPEPRSPGEEPGSIGEVGLQPELLGIHAEAARLVVGVLAEDRQRPDLEAERGVPFVAVVDAAHVAVVVVIPDRGVEARQRLHAV